MGKIVIDIERCKGCGFCVDACPRSLIKISKEINKIGYHPAEFINTETRNSKERRGETNNMNTESRNLTEKHGDTNSADKKKCNGCGFCYLICPDVAIEVYK